MNTDGRLRDDELGVDDAGGRELSNSAGRGTALHGVADEIAEARHAGQDVQPLQIDERRSGASSNPQTAT